MASITYICLLSLTSLVAGSPVGQHSLEKRQITVKFPSRTDEFLPRTLDGVSLTTVAMVVLMLIVLDVANTHTLVTTVSGRPRPNTFFPGDWDLSGAAGRIYSIFDIVEARLNFAGVEEQSCKLGTTCEVEQAVVNNPFARLAINTINSNLSDLSKYQAAVDAGLSEQDCSLLYSSASCAPPTSLPPYSAALLCDVAERKTVPPSTEMLIRTVKAARAVQFTCVSHGPTVAGAT